MEYIGDVFYDYGGGLYVNMTNRCPCRCTFCIRDMVDSLGDADSLWLKREPSKEELLTKLAEQDLFAYDEIVFCGYGEPTERLDCLLAISISLNAPTAEKYHELCRPKYGTAAFEEILRFTEEVKQYVPDVTMSVVGFSISQQDIEDCRKIAQDLGVKFRVR